MSDLNPYEEIDVTLDSDEILEGQKPLADVATNFVVRSAERKVSKENAGVPLNGSKDGKFPYVALVVNPQTGDEKIDRRKLFLNLSFHPDMLWQMTELRRGCGLPLNVKALELLRNVNSDQEYIGCRFSTTPKIRPATEDRRASNELKPPFRAAF